MSYWEKTLKEDAEGKPVPQVYNATLDDFEAFNRGVNAELLAETTITWDGIKLSDTVTIPLTAENAIMVAMDNSGSTTQLIAALEIEVATGDWRQWHFANGEEVIYTVVASSKMVIGPIECFPRYLAGRVKLFAYEAPAGTTKVQAQDVRGCAG